MKWFFCWCQDSDFRGDHNWKDLIRVSVESARRNTSLEANLIYDGEPSDFTDELTGKGVNVIFHRLSFTDQIVRHRPEDRHFQAIARGAFLRFDIPLVADKSDEFVLYTDADVIFLKNESYIGYRPTLLAAAPQFDRSRKTDMNSGVMLLNLPAFRMIDDKLVEFTSNNLSLGLDQEVLRAFLGTDYLLLPDVFNWKPYWGINADASILHWHGPKPETIDNLLSGRIESTHKGWQPLFERDRNAYGHYLKIHKWMISSWRRSANRPSGPPPINIALGKTATQSSVSQWAAHPTPEADAAGAVNGVINGRQGFHTDIEDAPWWMVDLGSVFGIDEIDLFNRIDIPGVAERSRHLAIDIGLDRDHLVEIDRRVDDQSFGGIDGDPYVFAPSIPIPGRYVRIRLLRRDYLHLDQVEIFGRPLP